MKSLVGIRQVAGNYQIAWDGTDDAGIPAASGVYVYRLSAGDQYQTRRLLLVK